MGIHHIQKEILKLNQTRRLSTLSYREIGRQLSRGSARNVHPQTVKHHIDQLIKLGQLTEGDRPATVSPKAIAASRTPKLIPIPIMGSADAGPATQLAGDQVESYLKVSSGLLRSKNYQHLIALAVKGNSMNQAKVEGKYIESGDYVVVDRSMRTPRNGEVVVVNTDDAVNIKRLVFDPEHRQVELKSESTDTYDPIVLSADDDFDAFVEGTVIQVIKG